jgi:hypothetical protein
MPPTAAVILDNLVPGPGRVDTREGFLEYYDLGTGVPCETVASLDSAKQSALIAASGGGIWDITDTSVGLKAKVVNELAAPGTFTVDRWQHKNFRKADEEGILILCNGTDDAQAVHNTADEGLPPVFELKELIFNDASEPWVAPYTRLASDDLTEPLNDGEWVLNGAENRLRVNWDDNDAINHRSQLNIGKNSLFTFVDELDPTKITKCFVTAAQTEIVPSEYTEYPVTVVHENGGATVGLVQTNSVQAGLEGDFIGVEVFKGRCYYWRDEDDAFYYTAAGAYQGEVSRFPLGAFVQRGGKLVMVTTWTQQDSGDGRDDFLVFIFSTGEILTYQGDDPGGIGFFEMVGRYYCAEPLSIRGRDKYGNDVIIMTKDGYIGLSSIIQQGRTSDVPQFSRLIHAAIVKQTALRGTLYGWDCTLFAKKGLMIFNVPMSADTYHQHVLNTVTQRWCRFKGINVNCFDVHNERLYGGTNDGRVLALLEGTSDEGEPIEFDCLYAFNYLGDPGNHKHITAAQVLTTHSAPEFIQLHGYADFDVPVLTPVDYPPIDEVGTWSIPPAQPAQEVGSYWDEHYWAVGEAQKTYKGWQNCSGFGYAVALLVRFAKLNEPVVWRSTTIRFHRAGPQ